MRIARPLLRLHRRDERGAIGVLIAVLVAGGVLLGTGALVIDVGQIYQNRAELQNGADSAALAIAQQCGQQQGSCPTTASSTAQTYTNANASALTGHANGVVAVCGSGGLVQCSDYPGIFGAGLTACPPDPANLTTGAGFVDVATSTKLPGGSTLLPPVFAKTLLGSSTYDGTNVKACAQAEWGAPKYGESVAFTISACEWATAISTVGYWTPPAPYTSYDASNPATWPTSAADAGYDQPLTFHSGNNVTSGTCPQNPAFADAPGAFGWTSDPNGNCQTVIIQNQYGPKTGDSMDGGCQTALTDAYNNHTALLVPVYSSVTLQGKNTDYTLDGFASFVITGFHAPGITEPDWLNPSLLCVPPNVQGNDQTCIDGFFTTGALCTSDCQLGGNNMGAFYIKLTG